MKTIEQFGVQPHSQGALYPAVIGKREYYRADGSLDFASWTLTLDGRTEEFASYEDAATVAEFMLAFTEIRADWRKGAPAVTFEPAEDSAPVKSEQSPAYGRGFNAYRRPQS